MGWASATILAFSANFVVVYSPLVNVSYRFNYIETVSSFASIMACRVFRGVALGTMAADDISSGLSSTRIAAALEMVSIRS